MTNLSELTAPSTCWPGNTVIVGIAIARVAGERGDGINARQPLVSDKNEQIRN